VKEYAGHRQRIKIIFRVVDSRRWHARDRPDRRQRLGPSSGPHRRRVGPIAESRRRCIRRRV